jgi:hypothetical protein
VRRAHSLDFGALAVDIPDELAHALFRKLQLLLREHTRTMHTSEKSPEMRHHNIAFRFICNDIGKMRSGWSVRNKNSMGPQMAYVSHMQACNTTRAARGTRTKQGRIALETFERRGEHTIAHSCCCSRNVGPVARCAVATDPLAPGLLLQRRRQARLHVKGSRARVAAPVDACTQTHAEGCSSVSIYGARCTHTLLQLWRGAASNRDNNVTAATARNEEKRMQGRTE